MPKPPPISLDERKSRLDALRKNADAAGCRAVLLGSTTSLRYFTGVSWHASERFMGAIVHTDGGIDYIGPGFERSKIGGLITVPGELFTWEEEQSPYRLIAERAPKGRIAVDDQVALFTFHGLRGVFGDERLADAGPLTNRVRRAKSPAEIALMQHAKTITLEVQRRARAQLRVGQMASDVVRFIDEEHRKLGGSGNTFCIVAFGDDSALPHGPERDRALKPDDVVLIDTGTQIEGYNSDITRTYVFGEPTKLMRDVWRTEKEAQAAAFEAAQLGRPCESADAGARALITKAGYGPDYKLPGVPHRTGHGIGLDVHEAPNLVRGDTTPLEVGMCFSNEPMIVIPGQFGIRHEDHFHMTPDGPRWFTEPAASIDDPFANAPAFA